jgi:hypothetical protein
MLSGKYDPREFGGFQVSEQGEIFKDYTSAWRMPIHISKEMAINGFRERMLEFVDRLPINIFDETNIYKIEGYRKSSADVSNAVVINPTKKNSPRPSINEEPTDQEPESQNYVINEYGSFYKKEFGPTNWDPTNDFKNLSGREQPFTCTNQCSVKGSKKNSKEETSPFYKSRKASSLSFDLPGLKHKKRKTKILGRQNDFCLNASDDEFERRQSQGDKPYTDETLNQSNPDILGSGAGGGRDKMDFRLTPQATVISPNHAQTEAKKGRKLDLVNVEMQRKFSGRPLRKVENESPLTAIKTETNPSLVFITKATNDSLEYSIEPGSGQKTHMRPPQKNVIMDRPKLFDMENFESEVNESPGYNLKVVGVDNLENPNFSKDGFQLESDKETLTSKWMNSNIQSIRENNIPLHSNNSLRKSFLGEDSMRIKKSPGPNFIKGKNLNDESQFLKRTATQKVEKKSMLDQADTEILKKFNGQKRITGNLSSSSKSCPFEICNLICDIHAHKKKNPPSMLYSGVNIMMLSAGTGIYYSDQYFLNSLEKHCQLNDFNLTLLTTNKVIQGDTVLFISTAPEVYGGANEFERAPETGRKTSPVPPLRTPRKTNGEFFIDQQMDCPCSPKTHNAD